MSSAVTTYYKATRIDGTDFHSGTVDYAGALESGRRVRVKTPAQESYACCTEHVLHASDAPGETLVGGGSWPCRLFEVAGRPVAWQGHKLGFRSLMVLREIEAWGALGPNGREVAAFIDRVPIAARYATGAARYATGAARYAAWIAAGAVWIGALAAAVDAARDVSWNAAGDAARDVWYASRAAAGYAAADAACALVARDLITPQQFAALVEPWRLLTGEDLR